MKNTHILSASVFALAAASATVGYAADGELRVVYREAPYLNAVMESAEAGFEAANPGIDVKLEPISSSSRDYYTKVSLMNQSASTAPDVIYEDGYNVTADAAAGFLAPLDARVANWDDWGKFVEIAKQNGTSFVDGKLYAIPMGTDTQAIWFNRNVLAKAGLPADWQPKTWQDILDAAAKIKAAVPDAIPLNLYVTKAGGEASTMRGLMNLLSGTPGALSATLYDPAEGKWVVGSQGMRDTLQFLKTAYESGYLASDNDLQDGNFQNVLVEQHVPADKVGMFIDGSWIWSRWSELGTAPWADWTTTVGMAKIPTQNGEGNGFTSMSGGWTIAMSAHAEDKDAAFEFLTTVANYENSLKYSVLSGAVGVREDVISDPEFLDANPTGEFFSSLVAVTNFRPAVEVYPQVSSLIQETMEAVTVGGTSVEDAMERFDSQIARLVGRANVKSAE
ncbi:extracellular solute-binding protein [Mariluticola halotolerans]|uniref:extracellular solute-binding protein n=1 Tax=Mariluticola halotolerans TaxID=2909283 RepID=UPI0026E441D6|nr:extracellular solute-binding protein [Mariluticola halotolerans]UJQ93387.1 extracellular solute-binding protein [Mariluticola halotolerans]